jgi:hypothetical protein
MYETDREFRELRDMVTAKWCGKIWTLASSKRGKINNETSKELLYTLYEHRMEEKGTLELCVIWSQEVTCKSKKEKSFIQA